MLPPTTSTEARGEVCQPGAAPSGAASPRASATPSARLQRNQALDTQAVENRSGSFMIERAQLPISSTPLKTSSTTPTSAQQQMKPNASILSHFVNSQFEWGNSFT